MAGKTTRSSSRPATAPRISYMEDSDSSVAEVPKSKKKNDTPPFQPNKKRQCNQQSDAVATVQEVDEQGQKTSATKADTVSTLMRQASDTKQSEMSKTAGLRAKLREKDEEIQILYDRQLKLLDSIADKEGALKRIRKDHRSSEKKCADLQVRNHQQLDELLGYRMDPSKVDDAYISGLWDSMAHLINNEARLMAAYLAQVRVAAPGTTGLDLKDRLLIILKADPVFASWRLQRYIWNQVWTNLFLMHNGIWAGTKGRAFARSVSGFQGVVSEDTAILQCLSVFKSRTATLLDETSGLDDEALAELVERCHGRLAIFVPAHHKSSLHDALTKVFGMGLDLGLIFLKSRAMFAFKPHPSRSRGLDEWTKPVYYHPSSDQTMTVNGVGLQISPCLIKTGFADGGKFEQSCVLQKAVFLYPVKADSDHSAKAQDSEQRADNTDLTQSSPMRTPSPILPSFNSNEEGAIRAYLPTEGIMSSETEEGAGNEDGTSDIELVSVPGEEIGSKHIDMAGSSN